MKRFWTVLMALALTACSIKQDVRPVGLAERGDKELASSVVGEAVMRELHGLDTVAYVRFASVYRSFQDIGEFMEELEQLIKERRGERHRETRARKPRPR